MKKAGRGPGAGKKAGDVRQIDWRGIWAGVQALFNYKNIDATLKELLPGAGLRSAILLFVLGLLLSAFLGLAVSIEVEYFKAFTYDTLADAGMVTEQAFNMAGVWSLAAFLLLFGVPFGMLLGVLQEGAAYYLIRLSGGKGSFVQQYYLTAVIGMSLAASNAVLFLVPVPCAGFLAAVLWIALALYFAFYVRCKAYELVHDISLLHAFVIVLFVSIVMTLAGSWVNDAVMGIFSVGAGMGGV